MYWATGVEPTNDTPAMPGCVEDRVDDVLRAVHEVDHALGKPASCISSNMRICDSGTRSLG